MYNFNNPGSKTQIPGSKPPRRAWKPQPYWLVASWLRLMEPARGEGCPSGQRRGPAAPGKIVSYLRIGNPSISLQLTPTTWGRKRGSPGSMLPRAVWKPDPHWLVADWLGLMEPWAARGAPPAKVEVAPLTGRLRSHPRIKISSISLQF